MRNPENTRRQRKTAFSVMEVLIAISLMTAVFLATMEMFVQTGRSAQRLVAFGNACQESQKAMQAVTEDLRESVIIRLPTDTGPSGWNFGSPSQYQAIRPSGTEWASWPSTLNTGIYMMLPAVTTAKINNTNGNQMTLQNEFAVVDRRASNLTNSVLIFRGNPDGSANPTYGTCLWAWYFKKVGSSTTKVREKLITRSLSQEWNAVTFKRLTTGLNKSVTVKIVAAEWAQDGIQSSESNGKASKLPGRSVMLRNSPLGAIVNPIIPPAANLPSPNTSPTPTPTPTPTPKPTPNTTPTPKPTPTPTPKPTPTPTPYAGGVGGGTTSGGTTSGSTTSGGTTSGSTTSGGTTSGSTTSGSTTSGGTTSGGTTSGGTTSGGTTSGGSATSTPKPTPTPTPKPTPTPTPKPTATPTPTPKPTPTPSPTPKPLDLGMERGHRRWSAEVAEFTEGETR
jgi:hypothetical protein